MDHQATPGSRSRLRLGDRKLTFGGVTHIVAVVNVSPESKNRHSVAGSVSEARSMAHRHLDVGASIIDVGGQSSHPDATTLSVGDELARLLPVVAALVQDGVVVSVDTWKPEVARACLAEGAVLVNDTGGMADPEMRSTVSEAGAAAVVMYIEAAHPHAVEDVVIADDKAAVTARWLEGRLAELAIEGIEDVIVDPGIAINYGGDYEAYTRMQLEIIRSIDAVTRLGRPVMIPIPRKREEHRVAAYIAMALEFGADLIRVHDVEMASDLRALFDREP